MVSESCDDRDMVTSSPVFQQQAALLAVNVGVNIVMIMMNKNVGVAVALPRKRLYLLPNSPDAVGATRSTDKFSCAA